MKNNRASHKTLLYLEEHLEGIITGAKMAQNMVRTLREEEGKRRRKGDRR